MSLPFVSIILPVRNEANLIEKSLNSIFNQDYPAKSLEILIADGMSTDETRTIIRQASALHQDIVIRIIDNPGKIVSYGLNKAIPQAQGEVIIRVDGHCVIAQDYVSRCVEQITSGNVDGVGGPMVTIGENKLSQTIAIGMSSPFGVGNSSFRTLQGKTLFSDTVPFPAYTRKIIEKIGLYDEELVRNQDDEYNYRLREAGGKLLLAADIKSTYFSRGTFSGLWRQYYQYGYWKVRVLQKHPKQMSARQFVPPLFVSALILSALLIIIPRLRLLSLVVPITYIIANLAASIWTARKNGWQHLPLLLLVFAILHVSYGLGFLVGLFKFWNRWSDKKGKVPDFNGFSNQPKSQTET